MLSTVARVAECDVAALLASALSPVQNGRRAGDGSHDGQRDADGESCAATGLGVIHVRVLVIVVIVVVIFFVVESTSARLGPHHRPPCARGRAQRVSCFYRRRNSEGLKVVAGCITFHGKPIAELRSVTC